MKRVSICDRFDALPKHYEEIFHGAMSGDCFASLPWFLNFVETVLCPDQRVRIYGVESGSPPDYLSLALPMRHDASASGKFGVCKLTALGNYYTPLFKPAMAGPNDQLQEDLDLLAGAIAADTPKWDIVDLHPLEAEGALLDHMQAAFRKAGMMAASYFCFGNWYLEVNHRSYREYYDALPSKLRNTIKRKTGRLANAGRLRIEIITNDDKLAEAIAAFEQVYRSSWKTPEPYAQFIPGLIRTCAAQGWLRMGLAYVDEVPAAAQLWIVCGSVASIYKLAYDERFAAESVGSILTARLMQHVIDTDKVQQVDFLSGDDPYKKDWMSHRRERHGIIAYNLRTVRGRLGALKHMGRQFWKRIAAASADRMHGRSPKNSPIGDHRPQ